VRRAVLARMTPTDAFQQFLRDMIELETAWIDERERSGMRYLLADARHHLCHALVALEDVEPSYDALEDDARILAREAFLSVMSIGQLLLHGDREPLASPGGLECGRRGVRGMLDHLAPYVSRADAALRRTQLDGVPLEEALAGIRDGA